VLVLRVLWQAMVFLRTDLYGVLMTYTGCYNLWEVKTLLVRRAFGRLTPQQAEAIADAHPRDLAVAHWFRWVYLAGVPLAIAYYAYFTVPVLLAMTRWAAAGLATTPASAHFWVVLFTIAVVYTPPALVMIIWCKGRIQRVGT
jgi:putative peptide zinc metalloprotease protein